MQPLGNSTDEGNEIRPLNGENAARVGNAGKTRVHTIEDSDHKMEDEEETMEGAKASIKVHYNRIPRAGIL